MCRGESEIVNWIDGNFWAAAENWLKCLFSIFRSYFFFLLESTVVVYMLVEHFYRNYAPLSLPVVLISRSPNWQLAKMFAKINEQASSARKCVNGRSEKNYIALSGTMIVCARRNDGNLSTQCKIQRQIDWIINSLVCNDINDGGMTRSTRTKSTRNFTSDNEQENCFVYFCFHSSVPVRVDELMNKNTGKWKDFFSFRVSFVVKCRKSRSLDFGC